MLPLRQHHIGTAGAGRYCATRRRHRVHHSAVWAVAATAAVTAASIATASSAALGTLQFGASTVVLPTRRVALAGPAVGLLLGGTGVQALPGGDGLNRARGNIDLAIKVIRDLRASWPADPLKAADAVSAATGSVLTNIFPVVIPAGQSLGVDIEGLTISNVNNEALGWQNGDKVLTVNGVEVFKEEEAVKEVKKARDGNQPIRVSCQRLTQGPFVLLERDLREVYQDTDTYVPESEDVMKKVGSLRSKASLLADGVGKSEDVLKKLDDVEKLLEAYVKAGNAAASAPAPAPKKARSAQDEDVGALFG